MSLIAIALKHMMAAGMDPDAICAAVAEMEAQVIPQKSKGAIRQANYRERHKASQSVTSDESDENVTPTPFPSPPNENNLTPPAHTPVNISTRAREAFPKPDYAETEHWADFLANRKAKRLPNTATAYQRFTNDMDKIVALTGWPPGEVLRACVAKGWGAIYDPRDRDDGYNRCNGDNRGGDGRRADGFGSVLREVANRGDDETTIENNGGLPEIARIGHIATQ